MSSSMRDVESGGADDGGCATIENVNLNLLGEVHLRALSLVKVINVCHPSVPSSESNELRSSSSDGDETVYMSIFKSS